MPNVSVIIPTYNRAHILGRAIRSVLNQTYQDFELIIVDDGSSDSTDEVVKSFDDVRIRYLKHKKNRGGAATRNTGIKAARGKYIAFQDSDDEWLPEKLEKQMKAFEDAPPEVGVVYTGFYRLQDGRKTYIPSSKINPKEGYIFNSLLKGNFITTQAVLVKRKCFDKARMFDENLPRLQDWELFLRISRHYHFIFVNEPLVIAYHQPLSISTNQNALIQALKLILHKHYDSFNRDKRILASYYLMMGDVLCSNGSFIEGKGYLLRSAKIWPLNIKALGAAIVALLGQGLYYKVSVIYKKLLGVASSAS